MLQAKLIALIVKLVMGATALGIGIWYLSSSIGGGGLTYTSLPQFLTAIGVKNNDIASANGCFLCSYIEKLFHTIGIATENFWNSMLDNLWVLLAIGFGIFLFLYTAKFLYDESKKNVELSESERKMDFKPWFDIVKKQGIRILIVGAFLGMINFAGTGVLKVVSNITIGPVMFIGSELSMAATGINSSAQCSIDMERPGDDILNPVLRPFMCTIGNLNTVMLAGAAGGFALMNYAWMDLGGGIFTWIAGLALVILFLWIGFDLLFQIFGVIFKLVFIIIFLPLILAFAAFEETWDIGKNVVNKSIDMLVGSALRIVAISLKIIILYATISFAADTYFPGPVDGYNSILPPILAQSQNLNGQTTSVISVFSKCESIAMTSGEMDKEKFKNCWSANRAETERKYPHAFDFMDNGFEFLLLMIGIALLYFYLVSYKIDELLGGKSDDKLDFGKWIKDFGTSVWKIPGKITGLFTKTGK